MVASLSHEFSIPAGYETPVAFPTTEPEVVVTVDPQMLDNINAASLMPENPQILDDGGSFLGGILNAATNLVNDVADAGQQLAAQAKPEVMQPPADKTLTAAETHYTHEAQAPSPNMMA